MQTDKHSGFAQGTAHLGTNSSLNLLLVEGVPLLLLAFVFGQPPRKGEKVSVENACREEKKRKGVK